MTRKPFVLTNRRHMQATRIIDRPEPGWFKLRMVKNGPMVPARISYGPTLDPETHEPLDRSWLWSCDIGGECDWNPRPTPGANVLHVWTSGERIDEAEYRYMIETAEWARAHAQHLPEASPAKPVNLRAMNPRVLLF